MVFLHIIKNNVTCALNWSQQFIQFIHFKVILQKQEKIISFVKIFPNAFKHNKSET